MNKININSIEAVILFILYICAQDDVIAEEELDELALELPLLQKLYLDMYGEFIDEDLSALTKNMAKKIIAEDKFIGSKITSGEKDLFSKLITDPKLQDVALLSARHAASADGLHKLESKKFEYWLKTWG
tara:strand:+ start:1561 stop:1950 length:390 start_codon:yes stop_codon:yes gene_type:complete